MQITENVNDIKFAENGSIELDVTDLERQLIFVSWPDVASIVVIENRSDPLIGACVGCGLTAPLWDGSYCEACIEGSEEVGE